MSVLLPPGWQRLLAATPGPRLPGSRIYEERSMSGQNRIPVDTLSGYVLAGARLTSGELPFTLDELVECLLVNGAVIEESGELYENIIESDPNEFVQYVDMGSSAPVYMKWERFDAESDWEITAYMDYETEPRQVSKTSITSADAIRYYHNPTCPEGILYHTQDTYRVVEKVLTNLRRYQSGPGSKTFIKGLILNKSQLDSDLMSEDPYAVIKGDAGIDRLGSTAAVDQLITELNIVLPMYQTQTHIVDMSNPVQRPSGADRALVLGPMLRFIDAIRMRVTEALSLYNCTWSNERIHTTDVADRLLELDLLDRLSASGSINAAEYQTKAGQLV